MACYLGLDVSDKSTHLCAVDEAGAIVWRGVCATDPETIARPHDVTQRGNRRQTTFFRDGDYRPDGPARVLLALLAKDPDIVKRTLAEAA